MAELRSSNPVWQHAPVPTPQELDALVHGTDARLTVTDVIMHTAGLMGVLAVAALVGWEITPDDGSTGVGLAAGLAALGLSFFLRSRSNPALIVVFAALEGVFVGAISHSYEDYRSGIVGQALLGTGVIFAIMLGLHRSGRLRATPKMYRIVGASLMGIVVISLIDLGVRLTTSSHLPILNDASPLGIIVSLGILVIASLQFTLDFDMIERSVAAGAPRREAWFLSYALVVSFVWVYLELLRLLGKLRR